MELHTVACTSSKGGRSPEVAVILKVQLVGGIVGQDEGKHRVLHQIIERSPGNLVQLHQILKVSDFSLVPAVNNNNNNNNSHNNNYIQQDKTLISYRYSKPVSADL